MNDSDDKGHFGAAYSLEGAEQTRAHYASWADSYDREVGEQNGYAQPARAAQMLSRYTETGAVEVLDAGCGSGLSGVALSHAGVTRLDGCDFSPEMLAKAGEKGVYRSLFEADLNGTLAVEDARYDAVTCVGVFSFGHVEPKALAELLRVVKPGGHIIVALNDPFWQRGDLRETIERHVAAGSCTELAREFGEHLPGHDVKGWVIALRKAA